MADSRHDSFDIKFGYSGGNKGKDINTDDLNYAVYNYRLEGDHLGMKDYSMRTFGDKEYSSLQSYSIHIQSKLNNPCSLSDFLNFKNDCVDITAKVIIGYADIEADNLRSRKRFSSGLEEGVITKTITDFTTEGNYLLLDLDGIKAKINFERAKKELLLSIDNDKDGKVDSEKYNYGWEIEGGDSDVHLLEGDIEAYIQDNFNVQENQSNDFLYGRKAYLKSFMMKVADSADGQIEELEIPISDFGDALVTDLQETYAIIKFTGDFYDLGDLLTRLQLYINYSNDSKIDNIVVIANKKMLSTEENNINFVNNTLSFTYNQVKFKINFKSDFLVKITSVGLNNRIDSADLISSATYAHTEISEGASEATAPADKKVVNMYCLSQSNLDNFQKTKQHLIGIMDYDPSGSTSIEEYIKTYQSDSLGLNPDGILGPKSYSAMKIKDFKYFMALLIGFAQDQGAWDYAKSVESLEDYLDYYEPNYIKCPGRRRSSGGGIAEGKKSSGGEGRSESLGGLGSDEKNCEKEYQSLISTEAGKEKARNALRNNANFMEYYKQKGEGEALTRLEEYLKKNNIDKTPECFILDSIKEGPPSLETDKGAVVKLTPESQIFLDRNGLAECSGQDWTKEDVYNLLKGIIATDPDREGETTGLNIGQRAGLTAQVLNPNKLKNKFKDLLRKRKKGLDFPWFRSNEFYLNIIRRMSEDLAGYMNAFVKQDAKKIKDLLGKPEYAYLPDEITDASISRYCKTGLIRQDRGRLFLGFTDLVNKNPMAIDSIAKKYIVKGYKDLERLAPNVREFDTSDVRYDQDTWKSNNAHDKTSGNILNDLVKLSNHLDNINEKAFSDRIEEIILETLGEK